MVLKMQPALQLVRPDVFAQATMEMSRADWPSPPATTPGLTGWQLGMQTKLQKMVDSGDTETAIKALNNWTGKNPQLREQLIQAIPQLGQQSQTPVTPPIPSPAGAGAIELEPPAGAPAVTPNKLGPQSSVEELTAHKGKLQQALQRVDQLIQQKSGPTPDGTPPVAQPTIPSTPNPGILGNAPSAGAGWAEQVGNIAGGVAKAPGRAVGRGLDWLKQKGRDIGRGFTGAESEFPILTAQQSSAFHLIRR